jgi:hypothetical protein
MAWIQTSCIRIFDFCNYLHNLLLLHFGGNISRKLWSIFNFRNSDARKKIHIFSASWHDHSSAHPKRQAISFYSLVYRMEPHSNTAFHSSNCSELWRCLEFISYRTALITLVCDGRAAYIQGLLHTATQSVLRQVHTLLQSEFSKECDLVLRFEVYGMFNISLTFWHPSFTFKF